MALETGEFGVIPKDLTKFGTFESQVQFCTSQVSVKNFGQQFGRVYDKQPIPN